MANFNTINDNFCDQGPIFTKTQFLRMFFKFRKKPTKSYEQLFQSLINEKSIDENELDFLIDLINHIRPKEINYSIRPTIRPLLDFLKDQEDLRTKFKKYIDNLFFKRRFTLILSETGIIKDARFFGEVKDRIISKFLPEQPEKDTLEYILNQVLYKDSDYIWIENIPFEELIELATILELNSFYSSSDENTPITEILNAMSLIIQRVSGRFLEREVLEMIPEYENIESPFETFEKELDILHKKIYGSEKHSLSSNDENYLKIQSIYSECEGLIEKAFLNSKIYGISLRTNQSLLRIQQQLHRLGVLLPFLVIDKDSDKAENSLRLAITLIRYNCRKNNISKLIEESTQTIAYEITQHTAKTGEHYITHSKKDYFNMLLTAMGGGMVVGFMCVFKVLISKANVSDFGHAFLYSLNYSFGFIVIYLLGFTLATKQPAMTAAAIVKSIDIGLRKSTNENDRHRAFAELFSQLFRSQFIAFVGNVIVAFPVALGLVAMSYYLLDFNPVMHKSEKILNELSPIHSAAIFHAAIAGVFLFLSGIIAGSIANRNKHKRVIYRISEHPVLKKTIGKERTKDFALWVEDKWPGIASNFWFGVFMGSTAIIGVFFGLNLDVRHITFASGSLALGLFDSDFKISNWMLFWGIFGIGIIGFMNFIVSFLLSLGVAFRSRNIETSEIKFLFRSVWHYFKRNPLSFFIPISGSIKNSDENEKNTKQHRNPIHSSKKEN